MARKPLEQHILTSPNGKRDLGNREIAVIDIAKLVKPDAPPMPEKLGVKGATEWVKIWNAGYWLRPDQDYHWVEQIARYYDEIETFQKVIDEEGLTVQGYAGQTVAHPLLKEQTTRQSLINKALSTLGYSPSDRARLQLTELKAESLDKALANRINNPTVVESEVVDDW